ncbi:MAG: hypothetical protein IPO24_00020 [Bacteroidetes bacterium]|nr:hypothetical protein [Bacteroidota bacterium]
MKSINTHLITWVLLLFTVHANAQLNNQFVPTPVNQDLLFLENKGQLVNADNAAAENVLYALTTPQFSVFIYNNGISYQFTQIDEKTKSLSKIYLPT